MSHPFAIAIHGGAGTLLRTEMSDSFKAELLSVLETSVRAGHQVLISGGDALDAVVAAVNVLENSEHFNAGKGSVLTHDEMVEMDAAVMHGHSMDVGAIAGVKHIKNPICLARDVMKHSPHVFLIAEGAEKFAFEQGYLYTEQDYFYTDRRYEQLMVLKELDEQALSESSSNTTYPDDKKYGTVGAVACDQFGNLAAATSTGGIANKKYGRVGDSPIIGAGTFAENNNVAVSATGMGEYFIRKMVASDIAARMRYLNETVATACDTVIQGDLKSMGGEGGVIAIDAQGEIHFALNTQGMYRASIDVHGELTVKIFADE